MNFGRWQPETKSEGEKRDKGEVEVSTPNSDFGLDAERAMPLSE